MIQLKNKKDCCGCCACVQRCPKRCITMAEDEEGFLYPNIDVSLCIDCGLCEKVCPVINKNDARSVNNVFAAINSNDNIRLQSSSGGIFTVLAEKIIDCGGVVFGVGFNQHWEAVHSYTETKEGIADFRMSKYVQSIVGTTYKEAELFLKQGRFVLYSGTPCQIAGLRNYLRKEYSNLLTVDFICHGVPSPGVFRWYLSEEIKKNSPLKSSKKVFLAKDIQTIPKVDVIAEEYGIRIRNIKFRDKQQGWENYRFTFDFTIKSDSGFEKNISLSYPNDKNDFLRGFVNDIYLRPSCYDCPSKQLKSGSDITIGDFWGINSIYPQFNDNKGVSAVILNTDKSKKFWNTIHIDTAIVSYQKLCELNPSLLKSTLLKKNRHEFFKKNNLSFTRKIHRICRLPFNILIKKRILQIIRKFTK